MQLVEQPVQRLRQNSQPAVVFDQFQAGRDVFQRFFDLRADKKARFHRFGAAGRDRVECGDHAHRIQIGVHFSQKQLVFHAFWQDPGAGKVVLHHGDIAVAGLLFNVDLVFLNIAELDFLVLFGTGVDRRAGEGGIKRGLARWFVAIAHQLQVQLRRHGLGARVDHFVLDRHVIGAALQGVGFDEFDAADIRGLELDRQFIHASGQLPGSRHQVHDGFMGRVSQTGIAADQAGLRGVDTVFALVQQHKAPGFVRHVDVVQKF